MNTITLLSAVALTVGTLTPGLCAQEPAVAQAPAAEVQITARAFKDIGALAQEYKSRNYDRFENATGIFGRKGETLRVRVNGQPAAPIHLLIHSFEDKTVNAETSIPLKAGDNTVTLPHEGLVYISYFTPDGQGKPVDITITGGTDNGVYRKGDGAKRWQQLLRNPGSEYLDIVTDYTHLVYNKEGLLKHCPTNPEPLLAIYDDLIGDQFRTLGLFKYKRWYGNHMMGRNGIGGFMHADGLGAYYSKDSMGAVTDVNKLDYWAIAHEFGHVNQINPGLRWHGTGETTNNIFSMRARYKYTPGQLPLEDNPSASIDGNMVCGCFNTFFQGAIINGEPFRFQMGPSNLRDYAKGGDVFVSIVPFWQLELYYNMAGMGSNKDFYPDLCEKLRLDPSEPKLTPGESQVRFCCYACDVAGENLIPYFEKVGLLKEVDRAIGDYGDGRITITPEMIAQAREYGKKYKAPASPVIHLISSHSLDAFRNRLPVQGSANIGVTPGTDSITIDNGAWKNVVAYYTYAGNKLIRIALPGTGDASGKTTRVAFPEEATRVEAVAWDGQTRGVYERPTHAPSTTQQH